MDEKRILEVENLSISFNDQNVLENVNLTVNKGEVLAVIGPNGAGKSVLFRALLDLIPHSGSIKWRENIKIGYIPQKLSIERALPLTVVEFLGLKTASQEAIFKALNSVGISTDTQNEHHLEHHLLSRRMGLLSGGEFQRVMIAWSLVDNPDVLLFDEPTAGIDIGGEKTIYNLLHELQNKRGLTILLISHDLNIVYKYADNVICLNKAQICFGEPNMVLNPEELSSLYGGEAKFYHHDHPTAGQESHA